jgi:hypothetical protein
MTPRERYARLRRRLAPDADDDDERIVRCEKLVWAVEQGRVEIESAFDRIGAQSRAARPFFPLISAASPVSVPGSRSGSGRREPHAATRPRGDPSSPSPASWRERRLVRAWQTARLVR